MKTSKLFILTALTALGLSVAAAAPATAATQTQDLKLSGDPHVTGSNSLTLKAKQIPRGTLVNACFTFTFTGDLLDPGEGLTITPDGSPSEGGGIINVGTTPTTTRTVCFNDPASLAPIADGNSAEHFVVRANPSGSTFTLASVVMELTFS
jgi:hypothetical protein